jgi:hypothetical protein
VEAIEKQTSNTEEKIKEIKRAKKQERLLF